MRFSEMLTVNLASLAGYLLASEESWVWPKEGARVERLGEKVWTNFSALNLIF